VFLSTAADAGWDAFEPDALIEETVNSELSGGGGGGGRVALFTVALICACLELFFAS